MSKKYIGKTITGIQIADDRKAMRLSMGGAAAIVRVDGDCCSESWIEHIELPALGFPAIITAIEELALDGSEVTSKDGDVTVCYGCKISTDKGEIVIDYRNASNGYYGGNLCWPDDYFYGGVWNQNRSTMQWVEV